MKNWKKIVAGICCAIVVVAMFTGCSKSNDTFTVLSEDLGAEEYGIGFRKGDIALGLGVQQAMDEMIADGTAAQISEKWFGKDIMLKDAAYKKESVAPAEDKSLDELKARGVMVLGLDENFPPMGFRNDSNDIDGFDIDLAKEVAKRLGVELKLQPIDWDAKEMELSTGKIDCIWNGMSITEERIENMYFAKPYIANKQIVIVPEGSDVKTIADMKGKIVGLQKGSTSLDALDKNPIKDEVKEISQYPDNVTAFMDLKADRVDVFVVDEVVGRYMLQTQQ